jgi:hypothetical protein
MTIWYALVVAPVLALADQSIALAMTPWACRGQHGIALHGVHVAFALATAAAAWLAWRRWRETSPPAGGEGAARRHFLAGLAIAVSALSLLVILTMWMPTWVLSPCLE